MCMSLGRTKHAPCIWLWRGKLQGSDVYVLFLSFSSVSKMALWLVFRQLSGLLGQCGRGKHACPAGRKMTCLLSQCFWIPASSSSVSSNLTLLLYTCFCTCTLYMSSNSTSPLHAFLCSFRLLPSYPSFSTYKGFPLYQLFLYTISSLLPSFSNVWGSGVCFLYLLYLSNLIVIIMSGSILPCLLISKPLNHLLLFGPQIVKWPHPHTFLCLTLCLLPPTINSCIYMHVNVFALSRAV